MKATGNRDALTFTAAEVEIKAKRAKAIYITACKEAPQLRESFKESLDEANANRNRTTIACKKKEKNYHRKTEGSCKSCVCPKTEIETKSIQRFHHRRQREAGM